MGFQLPEFTYAPLTSASLCALISNDGVEPPSGDQHYEAVLDDAKGVWIRLIVNEQSNPAGIHLHVDIARASEFDDTPEENSNITEILGVLDKYRGCDVHVYPRARFEVSRDTLPQDGVLSLLSSVVVDDRIRLSAGTLTVDDGPIDCIRWSLRDRDGRERLVCTIESTESIEVDDRYLKAPIERLTSAFMMYVLETKDD